MEEKQKEGYKCTLRYETWVFEALVAGAGPWKSGDSLRVFDAGQNAGARGILIGRVRKARDFELLCPRAIEHPDQVDTLKGLVGRKR